MRSAYLSAFAAALVPERDLLVSEWADTYRILDQGASAEPGPWRTARTPYLKEIMDKLSSNDPSQTVVFMKGSQIGATEAGNCWLGYVIAHAPGPMLYVMPTVDMVKRASKQRISPMIDSTPEVNSKVSSPRSRDSGNTLFMKEFPGGVLVMTGANSAVGLRSMPARYLFLDEIDAYDQDVDGEGNPIQLALRRTSTFRRNRKVFMCSTPTIKEASHIERFYNESDQRRYFVPCPHCGEYQTIAWSQIVFDAKGSASSVYLECVKCRRAITEAYKTDMLERGEWRPTSEGAPNMYGYHLSSLYSPAGWYSWADAVHDFLQAKQGGPGMLKTWVNTVLGETWEEQGEQIDTASILSRRQEYKADVPADAVCLTAGIDMQDDRIEVYILGWGVGEESWYIDAAQIWGDPAQSQVWADLDDFLSRTYTHELGSALNIMAACIDSGGHHTQIVYDYCRTRSARRIYATKGVAGIGRPLVSAPAKKQSGKDKRTVPLFTLGVDDAKGLLLSRLAIINPGPGYVHIPSNHSMFGEEFLAQLTAEKRMTRFKRGFPVKEWVKTRPRNEALDCTILAMGALRIVNPKLDHLKSLLQPKDKTVVQHRAPRVHKPWLNRFKL